MFKFFLILSLFLLIPSLSSAKETSVADVEAIYGVEFENTPPILRLKFENDTQKSWSSASYDEKEAFLLEWQSNKVAEQKELEIKTKEQATREKREAADKKALEKKKEAKKRDAERAARDKERARIQEEKRRQAFFKK